MLNCNYVKNKSSMETELRKILTEIYRGQKENNDEAVERILLLLNVVGQSEQLVLFADWLQYNGKWQLPEEQVKSFLKEQKQN